MMLFPDDIQAIAQLLQQRADMDLELLSTCQEHIELAQYDVAIFKAFRLLEGRIQQRSGLSGLPVKKTLDRVLLPQGSLTKRLGLDTKQAANLSQLLQGAFAFFRNPEAHPEEAVIDYGSAQCQAVLALVNLMLGVLDRQPDDRMKAELREISRVIGLGATERLGHFLERVTGLGVEVKERQRSVVFRIPAWRASKEDVPPKRMNTVIFSLEPRDGRPRLAFPTPGHWRLLYQFDYTAFTKRLLAANCVVGTEHRIYFDLLKYNSQVAFNALFAIVQEIVAAMQATVDAQKGKA